MLLRLSCFTVLVFFSQAVDWENDSRQNLDLQRLLVSWKDSILAPVFHRQTDLPPKQHTTVPTTTEAPVNVDDIAFVQTIIKELDEPEATANMHELKATPTTETVLEAARIADLVEPVSSVATNYDNTKKHLFGIPFSIKIMKSQPQSSRYTTTRVRWRTVPTPPPSETLSISTSTTHPKIQNEMLDLKELAENSKTEEDLQMICTSAKRLASTYGIHDMPTFARKNCPLIRLYFPYATCERVVETVDYCFPTVTPPESQSFV